MNIGFWNVNGLCSKWSLPDVREFLKGFDILCCVETWASTRSQFVMDGYESYEKINEKQNKFGRCPGGMIIFVKEDINKFCNVRGIHSSLSGVMWLVLDLGIEGKHESLLFGAVYRQPRASHLFKLDFLTMLENEMIGLLSQGFTYIIMGDFNCRIGELNVDE